MNRVKLTLRSAKWWCMTLTILYFAALREEKGVSSETLSNVSPMSIAELFYFLFSRSPTGIRFALNQRYVAGDTEVTNGDEIAFLPPLGGG